MTEETILDETNNFFNDVEKVFTIFINDLNSKFKTKNYHLKKTFVVFLEDGKHVDEDLIFDSSHFLDAEMNQIIKMTSSLQLLEIFNKNKIIESYLNNEKNSKVEQLFRVFLITYFERVGNFSFDNVVLKEIIFDFLKYFSEEYKFTHCFIPFYGLKGDVPNFSITDKISLKKITPSEFDIIANLGTRGSKYFDQRFHNLEYLLFIKFNHQEINHKDLSYPVLESFRLLKKGPIFLGAAYPFVPNLLGFNIRPKLGDEIPPEPNIPFLLIQDDFPQILSIYHDLQKLRTDFPLKQIRYINFSLDRFGKSYYENDPAEKITDLSISLESLLNKESFDVTFRLSLIASILLGNDEDEIEFLYKFFNKCYSVRSEIVHGKERKPVKIVLDDDVGLEDPNNVISYSDEDLASKLEDYTRMAIKKLIQLHSFYETQQGVIKAIFKIVINRQKAKKLYKDNSDD